MLEAFLRGGTVDGSEIPNNHLGCKKTLVDKLKGDDFVDVVFYIYFFSPGEPRKKTLLLSILLVGL